MHNSEILNKVNVYLVNGEAVRYVHYTDFIQGGHGYVYNFIPKNEIWIDNTLDHREYKHVIVHESTERKLMMHGMAYNKAHQEATKAEYDFINKQKKG